MGTDMAITMLGEARLPHQQICDEIRGNPRRVHQVMRGDRPGRGNGRPGPLVPEIRCYFETNWQADARMADPQMKSMGCHKADDNDVAEYIQELLNRPPWGVQALT